MKGLIVALMLLITSSAMADELIIHTYSYHVGQRTWLKDNQALNEKNFGLGIKTDSMIAGFYKNSEHNFSLYAMKYKPMGNFSLNYGVVCGYNNHPVLPFTSVSYNFKHLSLSAVPSATGAGKPVLVLHAALKFKIN